MMDSDRYHRPRGLLAGFSASRPSDGVAELLSLGEQWAPVDFAIGRHAHKVWECYLQLDGRSCWRAEGQDHELRAGMWYLVRPGVEHQLLRRPTGKHHYLYCELDLDSCTGRIGDGCSARAAAAPAFAVGAGGAIEAPFRQLVHESIFDAPWREHALRLACDQLVLAYIRQLSPPGGGALLGGHPSVARTRALIDQEPGQPWRVADLARLVDCSASHLAACFAKEVGKPIHQYLLERRLAEARRLLRDSDLPITRIALDLGFSSSQHFAKQFRKATGQSARQWRGS